MDHNTLNRSAIAGWLLLQAGGCPTLACAQQPDSPAPTDATVETRDLAVARAREALRALGVDPSVPTLKGATPMIWPNSSLGCPQPGMQYLQVQTPGYRVEFQDAQESYVVHVAGILAIVCSGTAGAGSRLHRPLVPLRGIDVMTQRAKEMLAAFVHTTPDQIQVVGFEPRVWPDTGLGCASPTPPVPGRVSGFGIVLEHRGREYTFNTDLHRVLPCPPIDAY